MTIQSEIKREGDGATSRAPARPGGMREVMLLAYPVILTQISVTAMQVVDSAMVGTLGASELGAVGLGGVWLWTVMCFFVGTTSAIQTFVSQHQGAGEDVECGRWTWQGLYATVPLGAVAGAALFFLIDPLMGALRPSDTLRPLVVDYVTMRSLGSAALVTAVSISSFFRGIGDTKTPLYATLLANAVNLVLDYGLIFGEFGLPEWGVYGAGLATSIAEGTYMLALCVAFARPGVARRFHTRVVEPSWSEIRRILRTGLPIGGQWWLEMTSFAALSTLVAYMGDAAMAASQAFVVLLSMSFMQAIGISMAVSTLVGQYIGARDPESADRSFRSGIAMALVLAGGVALLFSFAPEPLLRLFTSDPEVLALGRPLLLVGAGFQLFDALAIIADGALRGAGDTRWPFVVRFALAWGMQVPLAYLLGYTLGFGLTGAWLGAACYIVALAAILVRRFRSGAWQSIQI